MTNDQAKKGGRYETHGDALTPEFMKIPLESDEHHRAHSKERNKGGIARDSNSGEGPTGSGRPENDADGNGNLIGDKGYDDNSGNKKGRVGEPSRPGSGGGAGGDSVENVLTGDKNVTSGEADLGNATLHRSMFLLS